MVINPCFVIPSNEAVQVDLIGDLDFNRAKSLYSELMRFVNAPRIIINCLSASYIDSSILTSLMRFRRQFMEAGGDPLDIVILVPPSLRRIFEITGLVTTMTIVTGEPAG